MADTLEIRLGGRIGGRTVTTRDLDFSDVRPLIDHIESAVMIEAGIDPVSSHGPRPKGQVRPLGQVRLALSRAFTPKRADAFGAVYEFAVGPEAAEAVSKITSGLAGQTSSHVVPDAAEKIRLGLNRAIGRGLSVQL